MNQVDSLDEQILAALQANGRLTMKALAEQVGLSSPAMIERVRRLEERGVIAGYRAVISPVALGRPITAIIAVTVSHESLPAFLAVVEADPSVAEVYRVTGRATHQVKVHVPDTAALEKLVDALIAAGVDCEPAVVLSSTVPYRPVMPPEGTTAQRTRLTRRRRRTTAAAAPEPTDAPKRPGRPRGRRRVTAEAAN